MGAAEFRPSVIYESLFVTVIFNQIGFHKIVVRNCELYVSRMFAKRRLCYAPPSCFKEGFLVDENKMANHLGEGGGMSL